MKPTLGRIVMVYLPPNIMPAIVTQVLGDDGTIACTAFPPGQPPIMLGQVEYDPARHASTWHWPVRE